MSATVDAVDAPEESFSAAIREATTTDHREAEGGPFVKALVGGELDRTGLRVTSVQHLLIYRALEEVGRGHLGDPTAAAVQVAGLERVPALTHDVELLGGAGALDDLAALPVTADYVARLEATADWAGGFVAHHYTRLMGDLSGGQFIGRALSRNHPDVALRFYDFGDLDVAATKDGYRATLDAAPWDGDERARVIEEIHAAYALNTRLFDDLGAALLG